MTDSGGNTVPRITQAEHIGPDGTGDNIHAKRVANYLWGDTEWSRAPAAIHHGLIRRRRTDQP
jgi:hypothetical protein